MININEQTADIGLHGCLIESNILEVIIPAKEDIIKQKKNNTFINYGKGYDFKMNLKSLDRNPISFI